MKPMVAFNCNKSNTNLYLEWFEKISIKFSFAMPFGKMDNGYWWIYLKPIEVSFDSHKYGVEAYFGVLNFCISFDYVTQEMQDKIQEIQDRIAGENDEQV
jgi:hypothetical protein